MQKVGLIGRMGLGALLGSALAGSLMQGAQTAAPRTRAQHRVSPTLRSFWRKGSQRKVGLRPGQTEAQARVALEAAQAKRDRRANKAACYALASEWGYHPLARRLGLDR